MATEDSISKAVAAVVKEVREYYGEDVERFSVDPMPNGEGPYQVFIRGQELPESGLAQGLGSTESTGAANAPKRDGRSGSGR
jgi:hypothetical protein